MLTIETAKVFEPLLQPARYLGAYGGRVGRVTSLVSCWLSAA